MARSQGFRVAPHVTDAIGRPGVGIEWTYQGLTTAVIFSRSSYAYLGTTTTSRGSTQWADALVKLEVVSGRPPA
jgi:hypothetical protein